MTKKKGKKMLSEMTFSKDSHCACIETAGMQKTSHGAATEDSMSP